MFKVFSFWLLALMQMRIRLPQLHRFPSICWSSISYQRSYHVFAFLMFQPLSIPLNIASFNYTPFILTYTTRIFLHWFKSYLSSRSFRVKCDKDFSSEHIASCGVPQLLCAPYWRSVVLPSSLWILLINPGYIVSWFTILLLKYSPCSRESGGI